MKGELFPLMCFTALCSSFVSHKENGPHKDKCEPVRLFNICKLSEPRTVGVRCGRWPNPDGHFGRGQTIARFFQFSLLNGLATIRSSGKKKKNVERGIGENPIRFSLCKVK